MDDSLDFMSGVYEITIRPADRSLWAMFAELAFYGVEWAQKELKGAYARALTELNGLDVGEGELSQNLRYQSGYEELPEGGAFDQIRSLGVVIRQRRVLIRSTRDEDPGQVMLYAVTHQAPGRKVEVGEPILRVVWRQGMIFNWMLNQTKDCWACLLRERFKQRGIMIPSSVAQMQSVPNDVPRVILRGDISDIDVDPEDFRTAFSWKLEVPGRTVIISTARLGVPQDGQIALNPLR